MKLLCAIGILTMLPQLSFKDTQLRYSRVKTAYQEKEQSLRESLKASHADSHTTIFLRAFKREEMLEVWVKQANKNTYTLLKTYPFCTSSGVLGPKRREGDLQIPEGLYTINHFNPESNFHLSLGIDYPNASDRFRADAKHPGGNIYIHGNCVTVGCIPITDYYIKELYVLAVEARNSGQSTIPVHIFPSRLDTTGMALLQTQYTDAELLAFWKNLQSVFTDFEKTHALRETRVGKKGVYELI